MKFRITLIALLLLLPVAASAQAPAITGHPATVGYQQGPLQPVPFGWRLRHPFYLARLRTAYELERLQGGRWVWKPGHYEFIPSQGVQQQ